MDILKDIEKNILNINMYSKDNDQAKLNIIKKQIGDYFKYKSDENNVITQKIIRYEEEYKKAREINNYEYELFLQNKEERYNIYKETKELSSLYDYLNYKYENHKSIPDIYTYEHIRLEEDRASGQKEVKDTNGAKDAKGIINKEKVCPEGKVLNPITKRCVKAPVAKKAKDVKKDLKEPKEPKEPKKAVKVKECPEGKILNPVTNRCIKDVNYKKPKPPALPEPS
uniref:Uncharacterized protein n=1 Tax=viral metagenome TaxID=1070528 RepID=A0A6C0LB18_9ZZZZ